VKKILIWLLSKLIDNNQQNEENGKKKERKKKERKKKERNSIDPRRIKYRRGQSGNKIIFACAVWIILFLIFLPLGIFFLGFFYGSLISYAVWVILITRTLKFFLVSVPKVGGLVTMNLYDGYMETYEPGVHFKYPWEQVENDHYISMRLVNEHFVKSFPTNDGPKVNLGWTLQYYATIAGLPKYIAVDESKIKGGFEAVGNSYLSDRTAIKTAVEAREAVKELEAGLKRLFAKTPAQVREMDREMFMRDIYISEKKLEGYSDSDIEKIEEEIDNLKAKIENLDKEIKDSKEEVDSISEDILKDKIHEQKTKRREVDILERDLKKATDNKKGLNKEIKDLEEGIDNISSEDEPSKHGLIEKRERLSNLRNERMLLCRAVNKMEDKLTHIEQSMAIYDEAKIEQGKKVIPEKLIDDSVLEEIYGINLRISSVDEVAYEERYQKMRTTDQISEEMDRVTDRMIVNSKDDDEPLTREQAYNNALIINNNATKDVLETPGGAGEALASLLRSFGTFQQRNGNSNGDSKKRREGR
jgi:predicted  nucleic acid-binding Zn-ribbon protein